MSLGEADAKFPGQGGNALPPSPTRENPGQVYPKSSPAPSNAQEVPGSDRAPTNPRSLFSNPYAFDEPLRNLEGALDRVIDAINQEEPSGTTGGTGALSQKFRSWRSELANIRGSMGTEKPHSKVDSEVAQGKITEGGLFIE